MASFTTSLKTGKDSSQKCLTSRSPHPSPARAWLGGFAMAKLIFLLTVRDSASPRGACRAAHQEHCPTNLIYSPGNNIY